MWGTVDGKKVVLICISCNWWRIKFGSAEVVCNIFEQTENKNGEDALCLLVVMEKVHYICWTVILLGSGGLTFSTN